MFCYKIRDVQFHGVRDSRDPWPRSVTSHVCKTIFRSNICGLFVHWMCDTKIIYRQTSDISRTKSQDLNVSRLVLQWSLPNPLKPDREWSADRRCSSYIWVINNLIAYYGATYIRGLTVVYQLNIMESLVHERLICELPFQYKDRLLTHNVPIMNITSSNLLILMLEIPEIITESCQNDNL